MINFQNIVSSLFFCFLLVTGMSNAQEVTPVNLERTKRNLQQEREKIFIQALQLSVSQAAVFHPIFVDFNKEKRVLDDLLLSLFVKYGDNYQHLNQKIMGEFIKQSEAYERKELKVRKRYYKKLKKAISTELASQFYEVDDFVSTTLRINVLAGLPFTNSISKLVLN
jgi:SNF family Na+-dependent transporter